MNNKWEKKDIGTEEIEDVRYSPSTLAEYLSDKKWQKSLHLEFLSNKLKEIVSSKDGKKLIVNMPPRHGKSELSSYYFLFWYAINFPEKNVIFISYNSQIAGFFGKKLLSLLQNRGGEFGIKISTLSHSKYEFSLEKDSQVLGVYSFTGIGGTLTGKGADLIIIDDPIKNSFEAFSSKKKASTWEWYQSTLFTRLEPKANLVIVMTRWFKDDLCGRVMELSSNVKKSCLEKIKKIESSIKQNKGQEWEWEQEQEQISKLQEQIKQSEWEIIKFPAIAEENDTLGRKKGETLWEERFSILDFQQIKSTLGEFWFAALYQQEPIAQAGRLFDKKDFSYFTDLGDYFEFFNRNGLKERIFVNDAVFFLTADLAISLSENADYTVLLVFAVFESIIFVVDVVRTKINPAEHINLIKECVNVYNVELVGIEAVQYQTALVEEGINLGLPIKRLVPKGNKEVRAIPMAMRVKNKTVYFKKDAEWLLDFEKELIDFPTGEKDDQVDAFSYISQMITSTSKISPLSVSRKSLFEQESFDY